MAIYSTTTSPYTLPVSGGWTGSSITIGDVWYQWNRQPGVVSTYTTGGVTWHNPQVWTRWVEQTAVAAEQMTVAMRQMEEQMAQRADALQRTNEERSRRQLAEKVRKAGAQERALALFADLLTPTERADWVRERRKRVRVLGQDGTWFVISTGDSIHGNVTHEDEHGCFLGRVCVAPSMLDKDAGQYLPLADGWIGQLLSIRHDLANFRARGNWSSVRACRQRDVVLAA